MYSVTQSYASKEKYYLLVIRVKGLSVSAWEQYQFLRYYMPGFLFFTYLGIILVPALEAQTFDVAEIIGIFGGIIVSSPVIGYLIYNPFNLCYEYVFSRMHRPALDFIANAEFAEIEERDNYRSKIPNRYTQQKELIDLFLNVDYLDKKPDARINTQVLNTLRNQLNNFASRVVCGFFAPLASFFVAFVLYQFSLFGGSAFGSYSFNNFILTISIASIIAVSFFLLIGAPKVLEEAFALEGYVIRSKREGIKIMVDRIFPE
jgi:hypothetical protein